MSESPPQEPSRSTSRSTPHIRLNSGNENPFPEGEEMVEADAVAVDAHVDAHTADVVDVAEPNHMIGRALTPGLPSPAPSSGTFQSIMASPNPQESTDLLIPPRPPHRDVVDAARSPDMSMLSSRRTSWSSEMWSHDTKGYGYTPFEDSRAPSRDSSDENDVNTQTVSEKYNIMPTDGLLLFPEDVEKDDYLHNPDAMDRDRRCDMFNRRGIFNVGGLALVTLGFLTLFIGYPVMYAYPAK